MEVPGVGNADLMRRTAETVNFFVPPGSKQDPQTRNETLLVEEMLYAPPRETQHSSNSVYASKPSAYKEEGRGATDYYA